MFGKMKRDGASIPYINIPVRDVLNIVSKSFFVCPFVMYIYTSYMLHVIYEIFIEILVSISELGKNSFD